MLSWNVFLKVWPKFRDISTRQMGLIPIIMKFIYHSLCKFIIAVSVISQGIIAFFVWIHCNKFCFWTISYRVSGILEAWYTFLNVEYFARPHFSSIDVRINVFFEWSLISFGFEIRFFIQNHSEQSWLKKSVFFLNRFLRVLFSRDKYFNRIKRPFVGLE